MNEVDDRLKKCRKCGDTLQIGDDTHCESCVRRWKREVENLVDGMFSLR